MNTEPIKVEYEDVRDSMKPGDVIAFGGKGHFSNIIKWATRGAVSHVGVILQTRMIGETKDRYFNQIIESTSLDGFNGVQTSQLSARLDSYDGHVWWLPLSPAIRARFNQAAFFNFMLDAEGKGYDTPQAIGSACDLFDAIGFENREDFGKFFCSELVAGGLEAARAIGSVNASEVTPIDLCRWNIYTEQYYQLKGEPKIISRFNSQSPETWTT